MTNVVLVHHFDCVDVGGSGVTWSRPEIIETSNRTEFIGILPTFLPIDDLKPSTTSATLLNTTTEFYDPVDFEMVTAVSNQIADSTTSSPQQDDKIGSHRVT